MIADQIADMQAVGRRVEADIGGNQALGGLGIERGQIGALMQMPAFCKTLQKIGFETCHRWYLYGADLISF